MKENPVSRNASGRFNIPGSRNVELDLGTNDPALYVVVTKEIDPNLPAASADGVPIQWFAAFGVRLLNKDKSLGDYANIKYTIIMDALPAGKRLFAYYGGKLHERKFTTSGTKTRFDLEVGDPPIGFGP